MHWTFLQFLAANRWWPWKKLECTLLSLGLLSHNLPKLCPYLKSRAHHNQHVSLMRYHGVWNKPSFSLKLTVTSRGRRSPHSLNSGKHIEAKSQKKVVYNPSLLWSTVLAHLQLLLQQLRDKLSWCRDHGAHITWPVHYRKWSSQNQKDNIQQKLKHLREGQQEAQISNHGKLQ